MANAVVTVQSFSDASEALSALRDAEYREFLLSVGCPPDRLESEIEALRRDALPAIG
jgi:hypothetical protein